MLLLVAEVGAGSTNYEQGKLTAFYVGGRD